MIKINLLGEESSFESSSKLFLLGWFGSIGVAIVAFVLLNSSLNHQIDSSKANISGLEKDLVALKLITKEVKDLEKKKAELSNKLSVIATLKKSKAGPVRVLNDLNIAMPERSWLTEINEKGGNISLVGLALDDTTVAEFMQALGKSDYFQTVGLDETKQDERQGVKIKQFALRARVTYAGKLGEVEKREESE